MYSFQLTLPTPARGASFVLPPIRLPMSLRKNPRLQKVVWGVIASFLVALPICFPHAKYFCGHTRYVNGAVFAPDDRHFVSMSSDHTVRIWDRRGREQLAVPANDEGHTENVTFSPDSTLLASGWKDRVVTIRNTSNGAEVCRLAGHTDDVRAVAFGPDGELIASGSADGTIRVWNLATRNAILTIQHDDHYLGALAFSPDGKLLASAGMTRNLRLWNLKTGVEHRSTPDEGIGGHLLFSPDGGTLCSAHRTSLRLWDVATGTERYCERPEWFRCGEYIDALAFGPDGRTLAAGHEVGIGLWDVAGGKITTEWSDDGITPYFRSPDRHLINSENLFEKPRSQHGPFLRAAAFKPNGDLMLLGEVRSAVAMWRLTTVK